MNWFSRTFYSSVSSIPIFFLNRKLQRNQGDPAKWILLAKLYELKQARQEAVRVLKEGLRRFPRSKLLKAHLNRLQQSG